MATRAARPGEEPDAGVAVHSGRHAGGAQEPLAREGDAALEQLTARLLRRFPDTASVMVAEAVTAAAEAYATARVRDYVPRLVERDVVAQLRRERTLPTRDPGELASVPTRQVPSRQRHPLRKWMAAARSPWTGTR
jgi:hypothetical protein